MADKKLEKALYGPSTTEVALGAVLGLAAGLLFACVYLVFRPVLQVKEMPKDKDVARGAVYFIPGSDSAAKGKGYVAKQKALVSGTTVELTEDELNAWSTATFGAPPKSATPAAPAPAKGAAADAGNAGYDGIFNPGTPNFKIVHGNLQIGLKCMLNWYGLTHEVTVLAIGSFAHEGDDVVFVPQQVFLGSCPLHLVPKLSAPLMAHLLSKKKVPDEIKSAWAKVNNATIEGNTLKLTMQ